MECHKLSRSLSCSKDGNELIMVIGFQNGLHHHLPDPIVGTIQLGILREGRKGGNMHGLVIGKELGSIRLVNGKELVSIVRGVVEAGLT